MEALSLDELKAQNLAKEDEAESKNQPEPDKDIEIEDLIDGDVEDGETDEEELDSDIVEDDDETDEDPKDLEDWQKSETQTKSKKKFVPNAEAKNLRLKNKDLKAEAASKNTELEELRQKVEQLSTNQPTIAPKADVLPPRPKAEDFDYDEDRHNAAVDDWHDKRIDLRIKSQSVSTHQNDLKEVQAASAIAHREQSVTAHLNKAADLINTGKITEQSWLNSDRLIRQTLESIMPNNGNDAADHFISLMESNGEHGEKAWYYLGNNPTALTEFKDKVMQDNTGAQALMYLSRLQNRATPSSNKKRSGAPNPAPNLKGDVVTGSAKSTKKAYDKAGKSGDIQTRIDVKRKAKAAGVDTSKW